MKAEGATEVLRRDATALGANGGAPFDLIFLDPPYGMGMGERALAAALAGGWVAKGAMVVWEESGPVTPPEGFAVLDRREYGGTVVTMLEVGE